MNVGREGRLDRDAVPKVSYEFSYPEIDWIQNGDEADVY